MLSIKPLSSDGDVLTYYAQLGEAESHDYYSDDGARPGVWRGSGAEALGLDGNVSPESFRRLLEGRRPDGHGALVQNQRGARGRRAGFDLTFSLPKSFSVLWSQVSDADRRRLDEIAEKALLRTLAEVESLCGRTRRGKGSHRVEEARLAFAVFCHDTARGVPGSAPDANRHYHCVTPNVAVRADGTTGSLDARHLFSRRMKNALGTLFRAEASMLLQEELGVATYRPRKEGRDELASWWETNGIPASVLRAMSKRRIEVETWLRRQGLSGAKAAEKATLVTRASKKRFTWQELNAAWAEEAKAYFLDLLRCDLRQLREDARLEGMTPAVRLNGTSDIPWEDLHGDLFVEFEDIEFYDYTKVPSQVRRFLEGRSGLAEFPANYHLTFSLSESNEAKARSLLAAGAGVAVVFWPDLPATYWDCPVVNGDKHDARFLDKEHVSESGGYIVGLVAKGIAREDLSGFVVQQTGEPVWLRQTSAA